MKKITLMLLSTIALSTTISAAKLPVLVKDAVPQLTELGLVEGADTVKVGNKAVTYEQIGSGKFDDFFESSGKLEGLLGFARGETKTLNDALATGNADKAASAKMVAGLLESLGGVDNQCADLIKTGKALTQKVGGLSFKKKLAATKGVQGALSSLDNVQKEAPNLIKELQKLQKKL